MTRCTSRCRDTLGGIGTRAAHCTVCHATFTTPNNYDRHQRSDKDNPERVWCVPPARVGLERKRNGRWGMPGQRELPTGDPRARL